MAGAKIINLVDVKLREEMIMRDTVLGELMNECSTLREMIDALRHDVDQLKQGGGSPPAKWLHPKRKRSMKPIFVR